MIDDLFHQNKFETRVLLAGGWAFFFVGLVFFLTVIRDKVSDTGPNIT